MLILVYFLSYVQSEANFEMTELLQADIKSILNLLLLHLTSHRARVLAAIRILAKMNQTTVVYDSDEKIVRELIGCYHSGCTLNKQATL